ncbi:MAG TPA: histidine kinase dimerization/phospho-acceptor domain-containing protein, partial [Planctomycetota bacterium]|nr:histidine kinase dimerization/phospho-acceptor domain-containing protein [Planctomycetota bacterium]
MAGDRRETGESALRRELEALRAEQKASSELLDFVAHELMTPVTSLEAFSFILQRDTRVHEDPTGKRCLEGITRNTARLVALVEEFLEIGRIRAGRGDAQPARFDARDLGKPDVARAALDEGAPEVKVELAAEPVPVHADPRRLEA